MLHVISVSYIDDYYLELVFDDGTKGIINLYPHLKGSIFEPLQDKNLFNKVTIDEELQTISWYNGADFAPEFLKANLDSA
ncbi:MAG TPA: DUF2442 domain-containing protein [Rickettsia endosymbiont of Ceroptres masudai]|nr:DUF2442 domain-containing protein [Rickettsia endosymbiont of Ceroptres masudai]